MIHILVFLTIFLIILFAGLIIVKRLFDSKIQSERARLTGSFKELYSKWQKEKEKELKRIDQERARLEKERAQLEQYKKQLERKESFLEQAHQDLDTIKREYESKLTQLGKMNSEELKEELKKEFEVDLTEYFARKLREYKQNFELAKEEEARKKLLEAMQSVSVDVVSEYTVSRIKIPNADFKGKIIGRDGRNIRTFERLAQVDLIIDEASDTIGVSSYDPIRREVAKLALEMLIKDGRVHPGTIEEYVKKAKNKVSAQILKYGRDLAEIGGWYDAPKEALGLLGRMRFRISMGQNLYQHTEEVIKLSEQIGKLLDLDVRSLKIAALLHDVGKVLTSQVSKPHHHISAELARKWGLSDKIVNIIESHHGDIPGRYVECAVLQIADALSGSRPGARKEDVEGFVERVGSLEEKAYEIAKGKAESIFALKAGRQLWVVVKPEMVDDDEAALLAHKIAKEVEKSGVFPGEVEVVVIREIKAFAKARKQIRQHSHGQGHVYIQNTKIDEVSSGASSNHKPASNKDTKHTNKQG